MVVRKHNTLTSPVIKSQPRIKKGSNSPKSSKTATFHSGNHNNNNNNNNKNRKEDHHRTKQNNTKRRNKDVNNKDNIKINNNVNNVIVNDENNNVINRRVINAVEDIDVIVDKLNEIPNDASEVEKLELALQRVFTTSSRNAIAQASHYNLPTTYMELILPIIKHFTRLRASEEYSHVQYDCSLLNVTDDPEEEAMTHARESEKAARTETSSHVEESQTQTQEEDKQEESLMPRENEEDVISSIPPLALPPSITANHVDLVNGKQQAAEEQNTEGGKRGRKLEVEKGSEKKEARKTNLQTSQLREKQKEEEEEEEEEELVQSRIGVMQMWLFSQATRCYFEHTTLLSPFATGNSNVNANNNNNEDAGNTALFALNTDNKQTETNEDKNEVELHKSGKHKGRPSTRRKRNRHAQDDHDENKINKDDDDDEYDENNINYKRKRPSPLSIEQQQHELQEVENVPIIHLSLDDAKQNKVVQQLYKYNNTQNPLEEEEEELKHKLQHAQYNTVHEHIEELHRFTPERYSHSLQSLLSTIEAAVEVYLPPFMDDSDYLSAKEVEFSLKHALAYAKTASVTPVMLQLLKNVKLDFLHDCVPCLAALVEVFTIHVAVRLSKMKLPPRVIRVCRGLQMSFKEIVAFTYLLICHCGKYLADRNNNTLLPATVASHAHLSPKELLSFLNTSRAHMKQGLLVFDVRYRNFAEFRLTLPQEVITALTGQDLEEEQMIKLEQTVLVEVLHAESNFLNDQNNNNNNENNDNNNQGEDGEHVNENNNESVLYKVDNDKEESEEEENNDTEESQNDSDNSETDNDGHNNNDKDNTDENAAHTKKNNKQKSNKHSEQEEEEKKDEKLQKDKTEQQQEQEKQANKAAENNNNDNNDNDNQKKVKDCRRRYNKRGEIIPGTNMIRGLLAHEPESTESTIRIFSPNEGNEDKTNLPKSGESKSENTENQEEEGKDKEVAMNDADEVRLTHYKVLSQIDPIASIVGNENTNASFTNSINNNTEDNNNNNNSTLSTANMNNNSMSFHSMSNEPTSPAMQNYLNSKNKPASRKTPYTSDIEYMEEAFKVLANMIRIRTAQADMKDEDEASKFPRTTLEAQLRELRGKVRVSSAIHRARIQVTLEEHEKDPCGFVPRIELLVQQLKLSELEKWILLLMIGNVVSEDILVAINGRYVLRDGQRVMTVGFILYMLCERLHERVAARRVFYQSAPLISNGILTLSLETSRTNFNSDMMDYLCDIDRKIVDHIMGIDSATSEIVQGSTLYMPTVPISNVVLPAATTELVLNTIQHYSLFEKCKKKCGFGHQLGNSVNGLVILFYGTSGTGKTMLANAVAHDLHKKLLLVNVAQFSSENKAPEVMRFLFREARLHDAIIFFDECETLFESRENSASIVNSVLSEFERYDGLILMATNKASNIDEAMNRRISLMVEFKLPDHRLRERIWRSHIPANLKLSQDVDVERLALNYELTGGLIRNAVLAAMNSAVGREKTDQPTLTMSDFEAGARLQLRGFFLAAKHPAGVASESYLTPKRSLDELILDVDTRRAVESIANIAKSRHTLYAQWGFGSADSEESGVYDQGSLYLLYGDSGTGKSTAAEGIAYECGSTIRLCNVAELMLVQEMNINKVFEEGRQLGAIVMFDQAQVLFSHNEKSLQIAQLIQYHARRYPRPVLILATTGNNNGGLPHLDTRAARIVFNEVIQFHLPDKALRAELWRKAFPRKVNLSEDVDFNVLAEREISPKFIHTVAFQACCRVALLAPEKRVVTMQLITSELEDLLTRERTMQPSDFMFA